MKRKMKNTIAGMGILLGLYSGASLANYSNKAWHHPATLDEAISAQDPGAPIEHQGAYEPKVAVDQRGMAVLAYSQHVVLNQWMFNGVPQVEKESRIFVRIRCSNQWDTPVGGLPLSGNISVAGYNAYSPQVAMNKLGRAVVAWTQIDKNIEKIYVALGKKNANDCTWTWSKPAKISDYISLNSGANAQRPRVAMDDDGNAVVTWQQRTWLGSNDFMNVFVSRYDVATNVWVHPKNLDDALNLYGTDAYWPEVAFIKKGMSTTISWYQKDPHPGVDLSRVFSADFDTAKGTWIKPESFQEFLSVFQTSATWSNVAMNKQGEEVLVWTQESSNGFKQVYVAERDQYLHPWKTPEWTAPLSDDVANCCTSGFYDPIQLKMNNKGRVAASWSQNINAGNLFNSQIFVALRDQGKWKNPVVTDYISDSEPGNADSADIAMNDSGRTLVAWQQQKGSGFSFILFKEYLEKNGVWAWEPVQEASPNSMGFYTGAPSTTMNENGVAFITWSQESLDTYRVYLSQYY